MLQLKEVRRGSEGSRERRSRKGWRPITLKGKLKREWASGGQDRSRRPGSEERGEEAFPAVSGKKRASLALRRQGNYG